MFSFWPITLGRRSKKVSGTNGITIRIFVSSLVVTSFVAEDRPSPVAPTLSNLVERLFIVLCVWSWLSVNMVDEFSIKRINEAREQTSLTRAFHLMVEILDKCFRESEIFSFTRLRYRLKRNYSSVNLSNLDSAAWNMLIHLTKKWFSWAAYW